MQDSLFSSPDPSSAILPGGWSTAHCDGGSRGNPGPAAYGAEIVGPDNGSVVELSEYLGVRTNNYAEYAGLLAVLNWALDHGLRRLRVVSDSLLMVNQIKGSYKVNSPELREQWAKALELVSRLEAFEIVHTLRASNQTADRLANEAMDRGQGGAASAQTAAQSLVSPQTTSAATPAEKATQRGLVQNGVIHLTEGRLPEGAFVRIYPE